MLKSICSRGQSDCPKKISRKIFLGIFFIEKLHWGEEIGLGEKQVVCDISWICDMCGIAEGPLLLRVQECFYK